MSDDTRGRIIQTAGPIFAKKGFDGATVREICDQAGVNVASINYYFGGKDQLYAEVVRTAHPLGQKNELFANLQAEPDPRKKLRIFLSFFLTRLLESDAEAWQERLLLREILHPTPACRETLRQHFLLGFNGLQRILDDILPPDTPVQKRHKIGLSIVGQCVYYHAARNIIPLIIPQSELDDHFGVPALVDHILGFSLSALGFDSASATQDQRSAGEDNLGADDSASEYQRGGPAVPSGCRDDVASGPPVDAGQSVVSDVHDSSTRHVRHAEATGPRISGIIDLDGRSDDARAATPIDHDSENVIG